ncbi:MAG TPA: DUF4157 domain-containing protein [Lacipirellulaceae bacterium]|nr:DUF4157 domain-containing protein [Lacipirellulaceae bacterium]
MQKVHGNRFVSQSLTIQRKGIGPTRPPSPELSKYLSDPGAGQPLPDGPPNVRIHNDSRAHNAAADLNAQAMTVGHNIFFGASRYRPDAEEGQQLIAHELAHVEQQKHGGIGTGLVENPMLEQEADDAAKGRQRKLTALGRKGIQRRPEVTAADKKDDKKDDATQSAAPTPQPGPAQKPPLLTKIDLLPPDLRPDLLPEETPSERLNRQLREDLASADRAKGITHLSNQPGPTASPTPSASPGPAKKSAEDDLVSTARALLARCNRDQKLKGEPSRREEPAPSHGPLEPEDAGDKVKSAVEECLDTPEGEAFTSQVKSYLLSKKGAPVTLGAVSALLGYFAATGRIAYIPPIPLGDNAELSLEVKGPVNKPDQAMLTLSVKDVAGFGSWLWGGLKTVGRGIAKFGGWIWKGLSTFAGWVWTGITWLASKVWDLLSGVLGRLIEWMLKLPFRVARLFKTLIEGVAALRPWSLHFWESLGHAGTWIDFVGWLGTFGLELAEIAGVGEIYETAAEILKLNTRALSESERKTAQQIFGNTIPFHLVRVDERAVIGPAFSDRAYTSFHTINEWGGLNTETLIHELTHVWQYENAGAIYMPQALHAQATGGYDYGDVSNLSAAKKSGLGFDSFNREQQAQIVEDFYLIAAGRSAMMSSGTRSDLPLYAHFVKTVSSHKESDLGKLKV